MSSNILEKLTLEDVAIAAKALQAAAIRYRDKASGGNLNHNDIRIYLVRAKACERVSAALIGGGVIE